MPVVWMEIEKQKIVFDFLESLESEEKILIYGAGNVARRLYKEFEKKKRSGMIEAFIVSNKEDNEDEISGIPVIEYIKFKDKTEKILIGLWETRQNEIYSKLIEDGVNEKRIIRLPQPVNEALDFIYGEKREWEGSEKYWEDRYKNGGNSGAGSYNRLAEFKAEVINKFVTDNKITSVIEWGCGDGNQLSLANYIEYTGYDVSEKAIEMCRKRYEGDKTKRFIWCGSKDFRNEITADLALSLDVIYHLVEDEIYRIYMDRLFYSSLKYVCIYSSDFEKRLTKHVRCRRFTDYVRENYKEWELMEHFPNRYPYKEQESDNTSWSEFFFYKKMR